MDTYAQTQIHTHTTHVYMHTHIYTHTHTWAYTHADTCTYIDTDTHIHTYVHTHIHTYIHTHIYTHTHTGHGFCYLFLRRSCSLIPRPLLLFFSAWNLILYHPPCLGKSYTFSRLNFIHFFRRKAPVSHPHPASGHAHARVQTHAHTGTPSVPGLPRPGISHPTRAFSGAAATPGPRPSAGATP